MSSDSPKLSTSNRKPHVLIILDGWGHSDTSTSNAIADADTPTWDRLWSDQPHTLISGSGPAVGLPEGQMGNSEVGHMTLGAGRTIYQDYTRITQSIEDKSFQKNPTINKAVQSAITEGAGVHIIGLLSPGGVHSHESHLLAMVSSAAEQGAKAIYIHAFLDGRDTPPKSAAKSLQLLEEHIQNSGLSEIATISSIMGRYYAMDRDKRWDRIELAYNALTTGTAEYSATSANEALEAAYHRGETDEFVKPTLIRSNPSESISIEERDAVIFMNFRADRGRQLSRTFVDKNFTGFNRSKTYHSLNFVTLTQYAADIDAPSAFPPEVHKNGLGEFLAQQGKTQLRISETEKYAHVTFFFSCGREEEYPGEERILIPSPKVATYDLKPEMSAFEVTESLVEAIKSNQFDFIACNFANGDMVGHTGNYEASLKAAECIDLVLNKVVTAINEAGGEGLITADHGNIEKMKDEISGQPHTAHTCEPVPLIYVGSDRSRSGKRRLIQEGGTLADIAPTLLEMMQLKQPAEMKGRSLLK